MKFKDFLTESETFEIEVNDGAKKFNKTFKGRSAKMVEFLSKQKTFSHVGFWDEKGDTNFEFYFSTGSVANKLAKKMNDMYGYWFKSIGNNGRILEMELNEVGFNEFM